MPANQPEPVVKVCGICNRTYPDDASICEHDGQRLQSVRRSDPTATAPVLDWEGPLAGDIVGNYRIEQLVAEGGMGRIFKAVHIGLDRAVALKFLLPEHVVRADLVRRFLNEARAVNAIRHPHIIDIFDFVEDVDAQGRARVYMVMEHLDGEDARQRLSARGPYHPDLLIDVAVQVAETLAVAHDAGILHRDLKPDNIYLCRNMGRDDFVKLLDFGAAKAFGARPGQHLTRPGVAIGTPEYMSPEQIRNQPLDGRVDAYGLGCVCYELLTGTLPFSAPKVAQILAQHTSEPPTPIAVRRTAEPPASPELEAVVLRCMAKDPGDRFLDLWAVAEALRACRTTPDQTPGTAHQSRQRSDCAHDRAHDHDHDVHDPLDDRGPLGVGEALPEANDGDSRPAPGEDDPDWGPPPIRPHRPRLAPALWIGLALVAAAALSLLLL